MYDCEMCKRGLPHQCRESGAYESGGKSISQVSYREDPPKILDGAGDLRAPASSGNNDANTYMLNHSTATNEGVPNTFSGMEAVELPPRI